MDERSDERSGHTDPSRGPERDPCAIRLLFDRAAPLDEPARERLLATCPATETVVAEVRSLLALVSSLDSPDPWADDPRLGHILVGSRGRWRLDAVVGEGGAGRVYRAVELDRGEAAAIKVIDVGRGTTDRLARVADEIRALESIDHPGIVRVLDADLDARRTNAREPWIAMEFIDGARSITEHALDLPATDRPIECVLDLIDQAMAVVAAVHEAGVVHRDLKPSNLLVDASGRVRLIDFGVARLQGIHAEGPTLSIDRTREGDLVGTPAYMAPEQVDAALAPISTATDVHALGVLAYRLLTGRLPYAIGESLLSAAQAIRFVPPRDLSALAPALPRPIVELLHRALAKHPDDRPADAGAFRAALAAARDPHPPVTPIVSTRRRDTRAVAASFIVLAGVTAIAALRPDPGTVPGRTEDRPPSGPDNPATTSAGDGVEEMNRTLAAASIAAALTATTQASDIHVPADYPTIQAALDASVNGDVILIAPGTYTEEIVIPNDRDLTIRSTSGRDVTMLSGGRFHKIEVADEPTLGRLTVEGLTFNGLRGNFGEIARLALRSTVESPTVFRDCVVQSGSKQEFVHAVIEDCEFAGNSFQHWGPTQASFVDVRRCRFHGNSTYNSGAVHCWAGENTFEDCIFDGNGSSRIGGLSILNGYSIIRRCEFRDNNGSNSDAIGVWAGDILVEDCVFEGGSPAVTGNIDGNGGTSVISGSTICGGVLANGPWTDAGGNHILESCVGEDCDRDGVVDWIATTLGLVTDLNGDLVPDSCECVGDITGNSQVDAADLGILLAVWNTAGKSNPEADINGDGTVNAADLGLLLGNWGPCPE